jgi:hypothetical protein
MPPILQTISRLRHFDEARAPTNCTYETKPLSRKDTVEAQMSNVFHLPITEHTNRIAGPIACGQLCQRLGFYLALVAKQRNCASLPPVRPPDRAALESMKWRCSCRLLGLQIVQARSFRESYRSISLSFRRCTPKARSRGSGLSPGPPSALPRNWM